MRTSHLHSLIKIILAGGSLVILINLISVDSVLEALTQADFGWILWAVLLLPLNLGLEAVKWHYLLRCTLPAPPLFSQTGGAMLSGYALGLFTPARLGDYAGRAFYLRHPDKWELAALTLTDRLSAQIVYLVMGCLAMVWFLPTSGLLPSAQAVWLLAFLGAGMLLVCYLAFRPALLHAGLRRILPKRLHRWCQFLNRLQPRHVGVLLWWAVLRYAVFSTQFVLLIRAFVPTAPVGVLFLGVMLVFFAKTLLPSVTLMDLGIREGASIFFLGFVGVNAAAAFNASLLLFCVNLLLPALLGTPFLLRLNLHPRAEVTPLSRPSPAVPSDPSSQHHHAA